MCLEFVCLILSEGVMIKLVIYSIIVVILEVQLEVMLCILLYSVVRG